MWVKGDESFMKEWERFLAQTSFREGKGREAIEITPDQTSQQSPVSVFKAAHLDHHQFVINKAAQDFFRNQTHMNGESLSLSLPHSLSNSSLPTTTRMTQMSTVCAHAWHHHHTGTSTLFQCWPQKSWRQHTQTTRHQQTKKHSTTLTVVFRS